MTKNKYTHVVMCPTCHIHLWIRRRKGELNYFCIRCGYSMNVEQPRKAGPMDVPVKQLEIDFRIDE